MTEKREEAASVAEETCELVDAVAGLTMRGGKRLRPLVMATAYRAIRSDGPIAALVDAGAGLELLQSYLLIHDDWMDLDDERRGGPSVYATMRDAHDDEHLGASLTVLAGDLASAYACELMSTAPFPPGRHQAALAEFWRLQREVLFGQQLDILAHENVEQMYDLKTGAYTVRGPQRLGALLADGSAEQLAALDRFGAPLGIAFQIRDELLGTFGDPKTTGKPAGNDLRSGKHTTLIAHARRVVPESERRPLEDVLGRKDASEEAIADASILLERCGARQHAEERLSDLAGESLAALRDAPLQTDGLLSLAKLLTERDH
ncbi:MAG: polyprenyl synthetase family protein [Planctomycetota bacterium]